MFKKWMWAVPTGLLVVGAVTGGVVGGSIANQHANPYRAYSSTPVGSSNSDLIQSYFAAAVNGTRLLLLPGYIHTIPLVQALSVTPEENQPMYDYLNNVGFVLLDDSYGMPTFKGNQVDTSVSQALWTSQVASVTFRTDLGSFLTGIAVGEFLNEYQYYFGDDGKLTWATYGGATFSSVTGYMGGLQRGIRWFNENIVPYATTKDGKPYKTVDQVFINNSKTGNFVDGFGITDGNQLITSFLEKNVDMLMPVAGPQTQQAVRLIKQFKKKTIVLGVDTAAEDDTNTNLELPVLGSQEVNGSKAIGGTNKIIQFSSLKKLDNASDQIMQNINNGVKLPTTSSDDSSEFIGGFGYQSLGTTKNRSVGVSQAGYQYFIKAMKVWEKTKGNVSKQHISQEDMNQILDSTLNLSNEQLSSEYEKYVQTISNQDFFKALNNSENKVYFTIPNWKEDTPQDQGNTSWSYADLQNEGRQMMPLDKNELPNWFNNVYLKMPGNENLTEQDKQERLQSLYQWMDDNQKTIEIRSKFNLKNQLEKKEYDENHSLIKVVSTTPVTPLLDKSFCQSTYMGLVAYWRSKEVYLPVPQA